MSLLRIRCPLREAPLPCRWALVDGAREAVSGEGTLAQLPAHAGRVQLVLPAEDVLLARARLPPGAGRRSGSVLAFAVEEETLGEPEANDVRWIGTAGDTDALAVWDRKGMARLRDALDAAGIRAYEVHCETLLLPRAEGEWSLAWGGREGFVRTGEFDGATTDCGDRESPPLSLRLMLDEAAARGAQPTAIALYATAPNAAPAIEAWQRTLGVVLRLAGPWDWRTAPPQAGVSLLQARRPWRMPPDVAARLRPAAWLAGAALAIHAVALAADWALLASEQRGLHRQMEAQFRAAFPDAVAVTDPALQMRRKLADARRAAGQSDSGDFLPIIENVAAALSELPPGSLRVVSYERGRMTLELGAIDEAAVRGVVARLLQTGLLVDAPVASKRPAGGAVVLTLRPS